MAKSAYIGVSSKAKKVKKIYIGVGGKAKKVKKAYIGVNGVAKLFYAAGGLFFGIGGSNYPFEYDSSSETYATISGITQAIYARTTTIRYANGKWFWAGGGKTSKENIYFFYMDEKTHAVTSFRIFDNTTGFGSGYTAGLENDKDNAYLLIHQSNNSDRSYFVTISLSDYNFSIVQLPNTLKGYINGSWQYPWLTLLPNGKFLICTGSGAYKSVVVYDRTTNTGSALNPAISNFGGWLESRAKTNDKVWFMLNQYNMAVTDGSTVTYWNDSSGGLGAYNGAGAVFGNGKCVFTGGNTYISTDNGTTWSKATGITPSQFWPKAITYGDGLFIVLSSGSNSTPFNVLVSKDVITWTVIGTLNTESVYYCDVAYSDVGGVGK